MIQLDDWQKDGVYVWYFFETDVLVSVDANQHWYWLELCEPDPAAIYLGKL